MTLTIKELVLENNALYKEISKLRAENRAQLKIIKDLRLRKGIDINTELKAENTQLCKQKRELNKINKLQVEYINKLKLRKDININNERLKSENSQLLKQNRELIKTNILQLESINKLKSKNAQFEKLKKYTEETKYRAENIQLRKQKKALNEKLKISKKTVNIEKIINSSKDIEFLRQFIVKQVILAILLENDTQLTVKRINKLSIKKFKLSFQETYLKNYCIQLFKEGKLSKSNYIENNHSILLFRLTAYRE